MDNSQLLGYRQGGMNGRFEQSPPCTGCDKSFKRKLSQAQLGPVQILLCGRCYGRIMQLCRMLDRLGLDLVQPDPDVPGVRSIDHGNGPLASSMRSPAPAGRRYIDEYIRRRRPLD